MNFSSDKAGAYMLPQTLHRRRDNYSVCYRVMAMSALCARDYSAESLEVATGFVSGNDAVQPVLTLKSINGTILVFSVEGAMVNRYSASTDEITVDFSSDRTVQVGAISFDIVDASANGVVIRRN